MASKVPAKRKKTLGDVVRNNTRRKVDRTNKKIKSIQKKTKK